VEDNSVDSDDALLKQVSAIVEESRASVADEVIVGKTVEHSNDSHTTLNGASKFPTEISFFTELSCNTLPPVAEVLESPSRTLKCLSKVNGNKSRKPRNQHGNSESTRSKQCSGDSSSSKTKKQQPTRLGGHSKLRTAKKKRGDLASTLPNHNIPPLHFWEK